MPRQFWFHILILGFATSAASCGLVSRTPPPPPPGSRPIGTSPTNLNQSQPGAERAVDGTGSDIAVAAASPIRPYHDWTLSETAADSLGRIGAAAVPALVVALNDDSPKTRLKATRILARIGPDAVDAVPFLVSLLNDPHDEVRRAAARALGQIGPEAAKAVPALMQILKHADEEVSPTESRTNQ